ncbi:MAG: flagellar hook capping FlgD N-terminal domain-containing protein [Dehalococcoidia bacterium]|jgi:flagellar hook assembly protein FlgD
MTSPIDAVTALQNTTASKKTSSSADLGQVDFMKLIIAQMRNQNPLEPQKDSDFMAQMAQFEALNQMKTVADSMKVLQGVQELNSAASMIGKTITGQQVDAIAVTRDLVGRDLYGRPFAKLTSLERAEVNKDDRVVAAAADLPNAGNEVSGRVDRVVTDEKGIPMLLVGSKVVDLFTISEVQ